MSEPKPPVELDETMTATPGQAGLEAVAASGSVRASAGAAGGRAAEGLPTVRPDVYEVGVEVARGGMGRIVSARDRRLDRLVAIKELHRGSSGLEARFEREAFITARLQHPAIVPVYEAGRWPDGEPFYAMRLVQGHSLRDALAELRTLDERLGLLPNILTVVEALAYAHGEHVIHRDLKPANILVGRFGETVVIDWGLAKDLGAAAEEAPLPAGAPTSPESTVAGAVLGTPSFMAPEQAAGQPVDERSDVYALGAILYQVVAGEAPYADYKAVELVMAAAAQGPPTRLAELAPDAPPDLVAIVERAMARDPGARYRTAAELADELRRFLTGKLVTAHRYTRWELVRRWLRKHRAAVVVGTAAFAVLVVGAALSFQRIVRERDTAAAATRAEKARAEELTLGQARAELERDPQRALELLGELSPRSPHWPAARVLAADALAHGVPRVLRGHSAPVYGIAVSPRGDLLATGDSSGAVVLWRLSGGRQTLAGGPSDAVVGLTISPDGRWLAAGDVRGGVWRWDLLVGGGGRRLGGHGAITAGLAFSPDSSELATVGADGKVRIWAASGEQRLELPGTPDVPAFRLAYAPTGSLLAAGSLAGVTLWDTTTGTALRELAAPIPIITVAFSPDGRRVAGGARDTVLRVWPVGGGVPAQLTHDNIPLSYEFSPSGRYLASVDLRGVLRLWDLESRSARILQGRGKARAGDATFTQDGRGVVAGFSDGLVAYFDVATGERRDFVGHGADVHDVALAAGDTLIVSASADETVRLWPLDDGAGRSLPHPLGNAFALAASSELDLIAAVGTGDMLWLWDSRGERGRLLPTRDAWLLDAAMTPDGALLATVSFDKRVRLYDVQSGRVTTLACAGRRGMTWRSDGEMLSVPSADDKGVCLYRRADGQERLAPAATWIVGASWSRRGGVLLGRGQDGSLVIWQEDGEVLRRLPARDPERRAVTLSPDGQRLATVDATGLVEEWPLPDGEPVALERTVPSAQAIAYSPDGRTLAVAGSDRLLVRLALADGGGGRDLMLPGAASSLRWSADGSTIVVPLATGVIAWIHHATGEQRRLEGHDAPVVDLAVSSDGRRLVSASRDGTIRWWYDGVPDDPIALRTLLRAAILAPIVTSRHARLKGSGGR